MKNLYRLLAATLLVGGMTACGDGTDLQQSTLSILLTDAPGDFHQAIVTIERIELVGESENQDGPGLVLRDVPVTIDLLTLVNDVTTLVDEFTVSDGTYSQLRFIIPGACIVVEEDDGSTLTYASAGYDECGAADGSLQLPSFAQTGIKVNLPGGSVAITGEQKILLVDFDVSQSFGRQAGNSGRWVMSPSIKATDFLLTASITASVSVADTVSFPDVAGQPVTLADFVLEATDASGDPEGAAPLTDPDGDGVFEATFQFLDPAEGPFSLSLAHDSLAVTTDLPSPVTVEVTSGQDSSESVEVTSATRISG